MTLRYQVSTNAKNNFQKIGGTGVAVGHYNLSLALIDTLIVVWALILIYAV